MANYAMRLIHTLDPQDAYNKSFGQVRVRVSDEAVEREFQKKLTAGYKTNKKNRCDGCFQYKSANGTCSCE